jgi:hypothetical protein
MSDEVFVNLTVNLLSTLMGNVILKEELYYDRF